MKWLFLLLMFLAPVVGMAQKKGAKKKAPAPFRLTVDYMTLSPCDELYMPWLTPLPRFLEQLRRDGARAISIDTSDYGSAGKFYTVKAQDDFAEYRFHFDSSRIYTMAQVEIEYVSALLAYDTFKSLRDRAASNYAWPGDGDDLSEIKCRFLHQCSRWAASISIQIYDDTQVWFLYSVMPSVNLRKRYEK